MRQMDLPLPKEMDQTRIGELDLQLPREMRQMDLPLPKEVDQTRIGELDLRYVAMANRHDTNDGETIAAVNDTRHPKRPM